MAALWFNTQETWFYTPIQTLSRWKAVMAVRMERGGFKDVVNNDSEVAGGRDGGWTSLAPILNRVEDSSREYYTMVIMCAADSVDVAKANVNDVELMLVWQDGLF